MRCKDCKWFARGGSFEDMEWIKNSGCKTHPLSDITVIDEKSANGICLNLKVTSDFDMDWIHGSNYHEMIEKMKYGNDYLFSTCDESRGEIEIGENFGCIHFEQKD